MTDSSAPFRRTAKFLPFVAATAILALAAYSLIGSLRGLGTAEVASAIRRVSARPLWESLALTGLSFLVLGAYDWVAISTVAPARIKPIRAWFAGATATAISNTLGFHAVTATGVRYRILTRSGLTASEVAAVTTLTWTALALAFLSSYTMALVASPSPGIWHRVGGVTSLLLILLIVQWLGEGKRISFKGFSLILPSRQVATAQLALGAVEMSCAIGALYILLPEHTSVQFANFCALYIGAVLLGIVSHVPGGVGVFEATILAVFHDQSPAGILAALLLYRLIYNLCPFVLASVALAAEEATAVISSKADTP